MMRIQKDKAIPLFILISSLLFFSCQQKEYPVEQSLNKGWLLQLDEHRTIEAVVPGLVHTDLLHAGLIPDPFYGFNEDSLQWIGNHPWVYTLDFVPDERLLSAPHVLLIFEGLDTYATIKLNGHERLQTDNMFRTWKIDVQELLRAGNNRLEVKFLPPDSISQAKAASYPIALPDHRAFSRKAPFQAGWDWGPVFHTMGIWKPVKLIAWTHSYLQNASILTQYADTLNAQMCLVASLETQKSGQGQIRILLKNRELANTQLTLNKGINHIRLPFALKNPKLWWPNGSGDQALYRFELEIEGPSGEYHNLSLTTGIRNVELVREADRQGESFKFRINGRDIFAKGANYIPEDHFVTRITREKTRKLLAKAAAVGMNMVRVWGGGIYPSNDFYEICDSLGLMVWQDFMFACTMYPWDSAFLANVEAEADHQVQRLRGHPSLVLWCGNNEVSEGFHHWGWQRSLAWSAADSLAVWHGYKAVFEQLIPNIISRHDPFTPYWPSSPSLGWGRSESLMQGDVHYWGVWWGEEPFEVYQQKLGRFHSEYGFQAMPSIESVKTFLPESELHIGSAGFEAHQKHPRGTRLINDYMARYFPVPQTTEAYIYMSQLTQAYGIGMAIEAHRRNMPHTMGTLYWQLNDSWPVTSWSTIDYYQRWKALHFWLKRLYNPILLTVDQTNEHLFVYGTSDLAAQLAGSLRIETRDLAGKLINRESLPVSLAPGGTTKLATFSTQELLHGHSSDAVFIQLILHHHSTPPFRHFHFFVAPKTLRLVPSPILIESTPNHDSIILHISSKTFQYAVQLQSSDADGQFSDNFFHLMPDEPKTVVFAPSGRVKLSEIRFNSRSLNQLQESKP